MLLLFQIPVEDSTTNIDLASLEDTSTRTNSASQDDPPPPPEEDKPDDGKDESGGTGTAMALDEGKMGKKDSDRAEGQYKMQKNAGRPAARAPAGDRGQARTAGILGSTALIQGGAFASLTGTGDVSSGFDDSNIYGGLLGNEAGEMNGGFGFGRSGFGPGGGGTGWGTIGTGRYGTIGHGSGTGSGYGVGGGRGGMRGRTSAVPTVSIGQPNAQGDLDKAIIRRYIKRNIQKITYCYEKQLLAKPGLVGHGVDAVLHLAERQRDRVERLGRRSRGRELRRRRHPRHRVPEAEGRRWRAGQLPVHVPPGGSVIA